MPITQAELTKLEQMFKVYGVKTRADWGAAAADVTQLEAEVSYDTVVVHHSGPSAESDPVKIQQKHMHPSWFAQTFQGKYAFADIGYHFLIDFVGVIYEGRPVTYKGAHVEKGNTGKLGVLVTGDHRDGDMIGKRQFQNLIAWVQALVIVFPDIKTLGGHRDFVVSNPTVCPGDGLYALLPKVREKTKLKAP